MQILLFPSCLLIDLKKSFIWKMFQNALSEIYWEKVQLPSGIFKTCKYR